MRIKESIAVVLLAITVTGCWDTTPKDPDLEGMTLYNEHKYTDATEAFRNAIRQNPRNYHAQYYLGASLDAANQYQEALQAYESGLDIMQKSIEGRTDALFRDKLIDAICVDIARVPDRDKQIQLLQKKAKETADPQNYILLARIYRTIGDPDSAIAAYKQAVTADPNNFYIHREFGMYLAHIDLRPQAADELSRARELNSQDDQVNEMLRKLGR